MKQADFTFKRFPLSGSLIVLLISSVYLILSSILIGFKSEQLILIVIFCSLYFGTSTSRNFILGFSIFIVYWIVFDFMKAFPNYWFNTVHIGDLYQYEKHLFGVKQNAELLTLNEFFVLHQTSFLDALTGFFYLCWVPVPLLFAGYLFFNKREKFVRFALTFLWVNIIGFTFYYIYPAAPPWYFHSYGNNFYANTAGSAAGLERFDHIFRLNVFKALYSQSSNVFAAMPSLHSAYPVIVLYYGLKNRLGKVNIIFALIMVGIWFSAIYNSHHYLLDIIAGICCAIVALVSFNRITKNLTFVKVALGKYTKILG